MNNKFTRDEPVIDHATSTDTPSEKEGIYWSYARKGYPLRPDYCLEHGCLRPEDTTEDDLPPTEDDTVRALDQEALENRTFGGKWLLFYAPDEIDQKWRATVNLVADREITNAKVTTKTGRETDDRDHHAIIAYTPNYFDVDDVFRVRKQLRTALDATEAISYKPTLYTQYNIYAYNYEEHSLSSASRYRA